MTNEENKFLEQLLLVWKNNPVFRDNLAFLSQAHLRSLPAQIFSETFYRMEDFFRYDLSNQFPPPPCPLHILNVEDTLDLLLENPKSFCRYGDGEILLINGRGIPFQDYDERLSKRLREILQSTDDKCYIGIDDHYFQATANLADYVKGYVRLNALEMRTAMLKYCNRKRLYIATNITCFYMNEKRLKEEYKVHYDKVKELFRNRKLAIFSGRTVFDKINHDVFEYAAELKHIFNESKNAWSHYEEILNATRQFPKDWTLCFILGPTATVLAYDLAQEGYTAWDIGHIAKDYDAFIKNSEQNTEDIKNFFAPD